MRRTAPAVDFETASRKRQREENQRIEVRSVMVDRVRKVYEGLGITLYADDVFADSYTTSLKDFLSNIGYKSTVQVKHPYVGLSLLQALEEEFDAHVWYTFGFDVDSLPSCPVADRVIFTFSNKE